MANNYVTLVAFGGTPVRLANQTGAAYATTGTGALVFQNGAKLTNPVITGGTFVSPFGFEPGSVTVPSLYFIYTHDSTTGLYSSAAGHVDVTCSGALVADFSSSGLSLTGALAISGNVTSGTWHGTAVAVPYGGTGGTTFTANGVVYGQAASALAVTAAGTTGQVLVATTSSAPSWSTLSGIAVTTIAFGTTGLTPSAATSGVVTVSGTLVAANGGTGIASYAVGDILYASASTTLSKLADVATGNALISGGVTTAPSWGKIALTTHVSGILPTANGGTGVANNAASTITISGAYALTATLSNTTSVTFPTAGTLATLAGSEALTNKSYNGNTWTSGTGTLTLGAGKTATVSNTLTFTGTDGSSVAFGAGGTVLYGNQSITLSGDITGTGTTAITTTLATVNGNVGSFGSATQSPTYTVNAKGLITAAANVTITPAVGSITGFGTSVATALAVNVGSAGAFVTFNGAGGTPSSMTATNLSGTAASLTAGTASAVAVGGITGLGTGVATFLATPTSANLASAVTNETGTGSLVFATSSSLTSAAGSPTQIGGDTGNPPTTGTTRTGTLLFTNVSDSGMASFGIKAGGAGAWSQAHDSTQSTFYPWLMQPSGGDFIVGGTIATNATAGFTMIGGGNGTPTGVPTYAGTGHYPLYYDYANNILYIYNGGWKQPKTVGTVLTVAWS